MVGYLDGRNWVCLAEWAGDWNGGISEHWVLPEPIGRVDVLWPCWLGNVCVLCCSCLSGPRVPHDLTVPPTSTPLTEPCVRTTRTRLFRQSPMTAAVHTICPCPRPRPCRQTNSTPVRTPRSAMPRHRATARQGPSRLVTIPEHSSVQASHLRVWATRSPLCTTGRRPLRVGPARAVPHRALPRLRLYYEPVRRPYLPDPALPLQLVGVDKRYGPPKFRCHPLDSPPWPATPARRRRLAF